MIKLFRKFRQQMLTENTPSGGKGKFTKYLIYAIGEIVLVVIGILIALNINNWNQEQTNEAKRQELLIGMTKDLAQDIASHERMIIVYNNRLEFFKRHLQTTDFSSTPVDTLFAIFDGGSGMHKVADQSYQKAKNLGIVQLCSDDSLSIRIDQYYTQTAEISNLLFKYDFDQTTKQNDFWITKQTGLEFEFPSSFQIPLIQDSIERRTNAVDLIESPLGRNYIKSECVIKELMLGYNKGLKVSSQELLDDIEAHLNKSE
jgi:hypothetical protein